MNTTPVGMHPNWGQSPVSLDDFPALEGVLDVVYNPLRTALLLQAEERGLPSSCGLPMLAAQAKRAAELFTGRTIRDDRTEAAIQSLRDQLVNVVLIGMPGCGKTTVGRALAERLGRPFVDLDEELVRRGGLTIPEIFAREGEEGFRARETALVREFGERTGLVVSTGGGVVTRRENYIPLKQNGALFHLRRDPSALPTDGRPLSQATAPAELWRRRAPLYAAFADREIDNNGPLEGTLEQIEKEMTSL